MIGITRTDDQGFRIGTTALEVRRGVYLAQAKHCWVYIQIGMTAFFIGWNLNRHRTAWRVEAFVPNAERRVRMARPVEVDAGWKRVRKPAAHPGQSVAEYAFLAFLAVLLVIVLIATDTI